MGRWPVPGIPSLWKGMVARSLETQPRGDCANLAFGPYATDCRSASAVSGRSADCDQRGEPRNAAWGRLRGLGLAPVPQGVAIGDSSQPIVVEVNTVGNRPGDR